MGGYPGTTGHPHTGCCLIDTARHSPDVGIVMQYPAVLSIHGLSRFLSGFAHFANQSEERFVEVGEMGHL